jgi:hypothetical protein
VAVPGYTDLEEVGCGGFGTVYRALQSGSGRTVAVKLLNHSIGDEDERDEFDRERGALDVLAGHPNILQVIGGGVAGDGRGYVVTDFLSRGSLTDRLERGGPLPWPEAVEIGVKIAGALETAHRAGILHRDVQPANILVSGMGEPKLSDFVMGRGRPDAQPGSGTLPASIAYTAPELFGGDAPSVRSDLYGLGATLYALVAGRPPFVDDRDESLVAAALRAEREPVPALRVEGVPAALGQIVERLLEKRPDDRYLSAREAGAALQAVQRAQGLPPTRMIVEGAPPAVRAPREPAPMPPRAPHHPPPPQPAPPPEHGTPPQHRRPRRALSLALGAALGLLLLAGITLGRRALGGPDEAPVPPASSPVATAPAPISSTVDHPAEPSVIPVLQTFVDAINQQRHADAFALLGPDSPTRAAGQDAFTQSFSAMRIQDPVLFAMSDLDAGQVQAVMRYTTTQPDGQACAVWEMDFTMTPPPEQRLIDSYAPVNSTPRAC